MLELFEGQIFDPVCGSGGMFCQSTRFVRKHQDNVRDISICGQESIILQKNLLLKNIIYLRLLQYCAIMTLKGSR